MRLIVCAAFLAALSLTGCGSAAEQEPAWSGPPQPGPDGVVAVDGFATYRQSVDEDWERSAAMAAAEFLRLDERTAQRTSIVAEAPAEGAGPQTVVVTLDGLPDDSVRAERWTLTFVPEGETYGLTEAVWTQRCQPGRGHQGFSAEKCV